ncbi:TPA: SymE family type I addiction module toxin [Escherichia fergusonii]
MAEHDITPEVAISKTQRRTVVGYRPKWGDTSTPALNLSGKWLRDAGFDTGTGVTVKISEECLILIAEHNKVQELRKELYQVKQDIKGMREGMFSVLNES